MADALDRLLPAGRDLLSRVDQALATCGVPAGHPLLSRITRLGVLPGEALEYVAALHPEALTSAAASLPRAVDLPHPPTNWTGPAADAFRERWTQLHTRQSALATHLNQTAAYADAVVHWMVESRAAMAEALVAVLGCTEAVTVRTAASTTAVGTPATGTDVALAAAAIGYRVLVAVTLFDVTCWSERLSGMARSAPTVEAGYRSAGEGFVSGS